MKKTLFVGLLAMAFAVACGDDEETQDNTLTQQEAAQGFAVLGETLGSITDADLDSGDLNISCPEGGSVSASGIGSPEGGSFSATVVYSGCTNNGVTINGTITASGSVESNGSSNISVMGRITISGAVNGTCGMNYSVMTTVDGTDFSVSITGSVCGIDASGFTGG